MQFEIYEYCMWLNFRERNNVSNVEHADVCELFEWQQLEWEQESSAGNGYYGRPSANSQHQ